jgi:hypothetical protein
MSWITQNVPIELTIALGIAGLCAAILWWLK